MKHLPAIEKLNLWETPLIGFEPTKDPRIVWSLYRAIMKGVNLPPVHVYRLDQDNSFHISRRVPNPTIGGCSDGGHNRALAHLIAEKPLPVNMIKERHLRPYLGSLPIVSIDLVEVKGVFLTRQISDPAYRQAGSEPYDLGFMYEQIRMADESLQLINNGTLK